MSPDVVIPSSACSPYQFGAALAAWGDELLVGAPYRYYAARQGEGIPPPLACRFARVDGGWAHVQSLHGSNAGVAEGFGRVVALCASFAAVGAPAWDGADGPVHEFTRKPDGHFGARVLLESPDRPGPFGDLLSEYGAAIAGDERTLVVGAQLESGGGDDPQGCDGGGSVYLFDRRSHSVTTLRGQHPRESFGTAVALDGDLLVVGAAAPYSNERLPGAIYVHRRQADGLWRELCRVEGRHPGEEFGAAVAVSGTRFAVLAPGRPNLTPKILGRLDVFDVGDAGCTPIATLDLDPGSGGAIALSGERLAVGYPSFQAPHGPTQTGRIGLYRVSNGGGNVHHERWLVAPSPSSQAGLGAAVALGPDYVAAGAPGPGEDNTAGEGFVVVSEFV